MPTSRKPARGVQPWWIDAAWRLYAPAPASFDAMMRAVARTVRPLRDALVPLCLERGPVAPDGRPGSLLVAGRPKDLFIARFFLERPERQALGAVPLWRLADAVARARTDMSVAVLDRRAARFVRDTPRLSIPTDVGQHLRVPARPGDPHGFARSVRRVLRRALAAGMTMEVSHGGDGFPAFYATMYEPFARRRYGTNAIVHGFHKLARACRRGGIVWVRQHGRRIAGAVFLREGPTLRLLVLGTLHGAPEIELAGALAAVVLFAIRYAAERGVETVDLGASAPRLSNGVLRHKALWGARLVDDPRYPTDALLGWTTLTPNVRAFLARHPLVFRDSGLAAVTAVADARVPAPEEVRALARSYVVPGLRRLFVLAPDGCPAAFRLDARDGCEVVVCPADELFRLTGGRAAADAPPS